MIVGNHDCHGKLNKARKRFLGVFESVEEFHEMEVGGQKLLLTHWPVLAPIGVLNLCGHVHEKWISRKWFDSMSVNVGVDQWGFAPANIVEIFEIAKLGLDLKSRNVLP